MDVWSEVTSFFTDVPAGVWVAAMAANVVLTMATWSVARRRVRRAGERTANQAVVPDGQRRKDTALTVAALVPAGLFLVMVVAGSMHGLVAFGQAVLEWRDGWEYLVPATLDGVSVAFGFLAFRAVRRGKAPDRCYRVVWGAAGASAAINFSYEFEQSDNLLAGGYVGLLSVLSMVMFHEFLSQFEDGAEYIKRANPKFGLRWLTWPSNTFLAAIAWRNHPPAGGTPGTIAHAVANLNRVRETKRAARRASHMPRRPDGPAGPPRPSTPSPQVALPSSSSAASRPPTSGASARRRPRPTKPGPDPDVAEVRVPTTAATVLAWADAWVQMYADAELWSGPLTDDEAARAKYGRSARQLRRLRQTVLSGALRRQAEELGVALPDGFVDQPVSTSVGVVGPGEHV